MDETGNRTVESGHGATDLRRAPRIPRELPCNESTGAPGEFTRLVGHSVKNGRLTPGIH